MKKALLVVLMVLCAVTVVFAATHEDKLAIYVSPLAKTWIVPSSPDKPFVTDQGEEYDIGTKYGYGFGVGYERIYNGKIGLCFDSNVTWSKFDTWFHDNETTFSVDLLAKVTGTWNLQDLTFKAKAGLGAQLESVPDVTGVYFAMGADALMGYRFSNSFALLAGCNYKIVFQPAVINKFSSVSHILTTKLGVELSL